MKKTTPLRLIIAALVGGFLMFGWGAAYHMCIPASEAGMKFLPPGNPVIPAMQATMTERAFYMFPGDKDSMKDDASEKALREAYKAGPRGIIVFDPEPGVEMMGPGQMGTEFGSNVLAALLGAWLLSRTCCSFICRVGLAVAIGLAAWASIDVSYWNWHRYPTAGMWASCLEQGAGWLISGIGIALVLGRTGGCSCNPAAGQSVPPAV